MVVDRAAFDESLMVRMNQVRDHLLEAVRQNLRQHLYIYLHESDGSVVARFRTQPLLMQKHHGTFELGRKQ